MQAPFSSCGVLDHSFDAVSSPAFSHQSAVPGPAEMPLSTFNTEKGFQLDSMLPAETTSADFGAALHTWDLDLRLLEGGSAKEPNFPVMPLDSPSVSEYDSLIYNHSLPGDEDGPITPLRVHHFPPYMMYHKPRPYDSSISPSSSRPCTAGYDPNFEASINASNMESCSLDSGLITATYPSLSSEQIRPGTPPLGSCAFTITSPSSVFGQSFISDDTFGGLSISHCYQLSQGQESLTEAPQISCWSEPPINQPVDFEPTYHFPASCPSPHETKPSPWNAALAHSRRPRPSVPFGHNEAFTSRCVQPNTLLSLPLQAETGSTSPSYHFGSKASFLSAEWSHVNLSSDETSHSPDAPKPSSSSKPTAAARRVPKDSPCVVVPSGVSGSEVGGRLGGLDAASARHLTNCNARLRKPDSFKSSQLLDTHMDKVANRAYVCEFTFPDSLTQCNKKFQRAEHLKRHHATHSNERPFSCPICGHSFGRTDNLKQHQKTHQNYNGRNSKLLRAKIERAKNGKPSVEPRPKSSKRNVYKL